MRVTVKQTSFVRRVISHYLMFGLISVFSLGAAIVGLQVFRHPQEPLRDRVHEVRELLVADYTQHGGLGTQALIDLLAAESDVAYAAMISPSRVITAHSRPNRIGQKITFDPLESSEEILLERPAAIDNPRTCEWWISLNHGNQKLGALLVGVHPEIRRGWWRPWADWLPYAIAMPVSVLVIGSVFLNNISRTHSAIERQLAALSVCAPTDELHVSSLPEPDAAAQGWNRLIEHLRGQNPRGNLQGSLIQSLQARHDQRFESILTMLPDGVALTDKEGRLSYVNRAFQVLLNASTNNNDLKGRPIQACFPGHVKLPLSGTDEARPLIFEVLRKSSLNEGVLRIGRLPMVDENTPTVGQYLWTVRDITQQKLAEEMRNEFICMATHELRTPLANIKAYAETLTENDISDVEQQKHFLNVINAEATRLSRFVEELLNISQMEAGSLTLARQPVELERLLADVVEKVRPQMVQKGIEFEISLPPKLPNLNVDKDKFAAALVNLLGNAAKYTPEHGRVAFKIAVTPKDVQIGVEDTGIGISAAELPKLFTKFFRSVDARVQDLPGSGLGLAFTQEVVRLHGGKLTVHSEFNKGSQFIATIPL